MAKKKVEELFDQNSAVEEVAVFDAEMDAEPVISKAEIEARREQYFAEKNAEAAEKQVKSLNTAKAMKSPCENKHVIVRHADYVSPLFKNPEKHLYKGGMAEGAKKYYSCPTKRGTSVYVTLFAEEERAWLEDAMGLEPGAMNSYKKKDNFWDTYFVTLGKTDNYLDLNDPEDVIKYRVLKANTVHICPSVEEWERFPKSTYEFYIIEQEDQNKVLKSKTTVMQEAWKLFGRYENQGNFLRFILEQLTSTPVGAKQTVEYLAAAVGDLIIKDAKRFLSVAGDEHIASKVFIIDCVDAGLISKKSNLYYLKSDGSPLCNAGEDSTLNNAANYLEQPRMADLRLRLSQLLEK